MEAARAETSLDLLNETVGANFERTVATHPDREALVEVARRRGAVRVGADEPGAAPLDADAVRAFASGRLAHDKIPRYVMVVEEFPMTGTGKVRKVEMRERSTQELGLSG